LSLEKPATGKSLTVSSEMRPTAPRAFVTPTNPTKKSPVLDDKTAAAAEKSKSKWMKRMTRSPSPEEAK